MGNGLFAKHNGGKVMKMKQSPASLARGYMALICLTHKVPVGRNNRCIRCEWAAREVAGH